MKYIGITMLLMFSFSAMAQKDLSGVRMMGLEKNQKHEPEHVITVATYQNDRGGEIVGALAYVANNELESLDEENFFSQNFKLDLKPEQAHQIFSQENLKIEVFLDQKIRERMDEKNYYRKEASFLQHYTEVKLEFKTPNDQSIMTALIEIKNE